MSSQWYVPRNPDGTQVIVGSMNMGYISDTARNRTHNLFRPKRESIPLGHNDNALTIPEVYIQNQNIEALHTPSSIRFEYKLLRCCLSHNNYIVALLNVNKIKICLILFVFPEFANLLATDTVDNFTDRANICNICIKTICVQSMVNSYF